MGYIQLKLPKRIRHKIENSKRNREAQANHEEWLQSQGLDTYTLKQKSKKFQGYDLPKYKPNPNQPKCSGERKLLGIGLMHKSNLVPVWDEEGAKEITLMKGNK